jgi:hypothetical protein
MTPGSRSVVVRLAAELASERKQTAELRGQVLSLATQGAERMRQSYEAEAEECARRRPLGEKSALSRFACASSSAPYRVASAEQAVSSLSGSRQASGRAGGGAWPGGLWVLDSCR